MKLKPKVNSTVPMTSRTDLRQVIDYTRDFSMFYSGVEYETYLDGCYNMGVRNFLMSYEYLKGKGSGQLKKYADMHLFIDSGAFTYMNDPKYDHYTIEQWEEQIKTYLDWAERHASSIFTLTELDLQVVVGVEVIEAWRKKYFEPFMLKTGIPVCFVYHEEGLDYWDKMCQRYPFVGLTTVSDKGSYGVDDIKQMLGIAEKYNTVVHGFGMTQTSVLPQLPFYTVDSTSWKSGFRYGQVSVWTGQKLSSFKKDDLETKAFPVLKSYRDIELDFDKIKKYYEPEILRVNVYAYQKAEKNIIERLKPLMYWKKAKAVKVDTDNLPADFFPSVEWLEDIDSPKEEVEAYARKMNINPEYEAVRELIYDMTVFCNWDNPDYQKLHDWYLTTEGLSTIDKLHDRFINRIVSNHEEKIADLTAFYMKCLSGESDKLLQLGTTFDRIVREREAYIDEEEEELVDISEEEVKTRLKSIMSLPEGEAEGMPEVDALDDEVYKQVGIIATRDEQGRLLKGQVAVRKPKQVYSKKYPKFACDTCFAAARCVEFKAGYACAYNKMFNRFDTRNMTDIIEAMQGMVSHNLARMQRSMVLETINGVTDNSVTNFINQNMQLLNLLKSMYENSSAEVLRQTRVVRSDGSREESLQVVNPQSGGILERLFSQKLEGRDKDHVDRDAKDYIPEEPEEAVVVEGEPERQKNARYTMDEDDIVV